MQKYDTIAETMRKFMETGPSVTDYPTYRSLNDAVGAVHGKAEGVCQALAGEKAWAWYADTDTGTWRKATDAEIEAKRAAAAGKNHGGPRSKVMNDADRAALDAQIEALRAVDNPTLRPLLTSLYEKQWADDAARKGSLKDRLAAAVEKTGLELAVGVLEKLIAQAEAEMGAETRIEATITEVEKAIEARVENA